MTKKNIQLKAVFVFFCSLVVIFSCAESIAATPGTYSKLRVFETQNYSLKHEFSLPELEAKQNFSLALIDLGGDGIKEIIIGAPENEEPWVNIYRADGSLINSFLAYGDYFRGGVRVAVGDLDGDGREEIITAPAFGGGPQIRIFDGFGNPKFTWGFFVFSEDYRGGVEITTADLNGDGEEEIVVASGKNQEPQIKIFNQKGISFELDFKALDFDSEHGLRVASIDLGGDGIEEILVSGQFGQKPLVNIYRANGSLIKSFLAYDKGFRGGVNITAGDLDGDNKEEIITSAGFMGGPHVRVFDGYGQVKLTPGFFAQETDFYGGLKISSGDMDGDGREEIVTFPERLPEIDILEKYIEVDLSEQKLYAYDHGFLIRSFLISSGISIFPTPQGEFSVYKKREFVRMSWYYGEGSPYNYDLPDVPHVLSFTGPFALHGTYWHNNFGHPMSHGCINLSQEDAAWIYDWAPIGTKVIVHE